MYFTYITICSKQQGASALLTRLQVFISEGNSTNYIYTISVPRTKNQRLVGASASSMLREGGWSHGNYDTLSLLIGNTIFILKRALSFYLPICLFVQCLLISVYLYMYVYLFICLSVYLSICLYLYLSICLVSTYICLSAYLSSVYLYLLEETQNPIPKGGINQIPLHKSHIGNTARNTFPLVQISQKYWS